MIDGGSSIDNGGVSLMQQHRKTVGSVSRPYLFFSVSTFIIIYMFVLLSSKRVRHVVDACFSLLQSLIAVNKVSFD